MQFQPEGGLTADEIQALQEVAWAETYGWIMARSRFYQEHLRRAGFGAADRPTLADGMTELACSLCECPAGQGVICIRLFFISRLWMMRDE